MFITFKLITCSLKSMKQTHHFCKPSMINIPKLLYEVIDDFKRRKKKCMTFTVDFEKANDCINWEFCFR